MVDFSQLVKYEVNNGSIPSSGQIYTFSLALVAGVSQVVDLRPMLYQMRLNGIQGAFIDNSAGTATLTLNVAGQQNLMIPAACQALFPLYMTSDMTLTFSGTGNVKINLLNFPTPTAVWSTVPPAFSFSGGSLQVADPILDATVANGMVSVSAMGLGSGDFAVHQHSPTNAFSGTISAATTNTIIAGAPSSYCNGWEIWLSADATLGAAANNPVTLKFATLGTIFALNARVPAAAQNAPVLISRQTGLNLIGSIGGDSVEISLGTALATGSVEYTIFGGTTGIK